MKKTAIAIILIATTALVWAQTASSPKVSDWRYSYSWEDPNLPGEVAKWTVYASNLTQVRIMQTTNKTIRLETLLNGAPPGIYALFTTAESAALGYTTEQSTNTYTKYQGKIQPGKGGTVEK